MKFGAPRRIFNRLRVGMSAFGLGLEFTTVSNGGLKLSVLVKRNEEGDDDMALVPLKCLVCKIRTTVAIGSYMFIVHVAKPP